MRNSNLVDNMIRLRYVKNRNKVYLLWKSLFTILKSETVKIQVLFKDLQIRVEQIFTWLLAWKENSMEDTKEMDWKKNAVCVTSV